MLLLQVKVTALHTEDMIFVLAKYSCLVHFFGLVYFVVINKFCSVLLKYSGKHMFSELPVLFAPSQSSKFPKYINNRVVQILMSRHCKLYQVSEFIVQHFRKQCAVCALNSFKSFAKVILQLFLQLLCNIR